MMKKILALMFTTMLLLGCSIGISAAETPVSSTVIVSFSGTESLPNVYPMHMSVSSDTAENFGFTDQVDPAKNASALDVMVAFHEWYFYDEKTSFTKETAADFLEVSPEGWVSKAWTVASWNWCFSVNGSSPHGTDMSYTVSQSVVDNGDVVDFFLYQDNMGYSDLYPWFLLNEERVTSIRVPVSSKIELGLGGFGFMMHGADGDDVILKNLEEIKDAKIVCIDTNTDSVVKTVNVTGKTAESFQMDKAGQYVIYAASSDENVFVSPIPVILSVYETTDYTAMKDLSAQAWYKDYVSEVLANGLMNGTSKTTFEPQTELTREMFVTILYRSVGCPFTPWASAFKDVQDPDRFSYDAICWAYNSGIVKGVSDSSFAPFNKITREQMATIMDRYATAYGIDLDQSKPFTSFKDAGKISSFAVKSVERMVKAGIFNGKENGCFAPLDFATRAEASKVIDLFYKMK